MKFFAHLGERVQTEWRRADCSEPALPHICVTALEATRPSDNLDLHDLLTYGLGPKRLPEQVFGDDMFGQPGLVVFADGRLSISVLFWLDSTTSIHDHAFCGAFHVLSGSSLHTMFEFDTHTTVGDVKRGVLRETRVEILDQGASRPIHAGGATIHSLFHLDQPSVSVVIRTYRASNGLPQFDYFRPGFACNAEYDKVELSKRRALIRLVSRVCPDRLPEYLSPWLESADFATAFLGLKECALTLAPDETDALLVGIRTRHLGLVDCVRDVVENERREVFFTRKRSIVTDRDLRFFLAVLLNVRGRENVLRLVSHRFPEKDPIEAVLECVRRLAEGPRAALGFEVNDIIVSVLRSLFLGVSLRETVSSAAEVRGRTLQEAEEMQIADLADALRHSELFRYALSDV